MENVMTRTGSIAPAVGSLLAVALALPATASAQGQTFESEHHAYRVVTVSEGLENPWSMAFLPNGDMLVTERPGRLRIIRDGMLDPQSIEGVPEVRAQGQGGMLEVAVHPQFESNRLVYLTYSKPSPDGSEATTALSRGRLEGNRLTNVEEIFEAKAWSGAGLHFGSKLAFDEQGYLFMTVGDRGARPAGDLHRHASQDPSNHQGTVLRLHDDGRVPSDNPFVGRDDALPEIWSYGHRNPQGLVIHPETGEVWSNEHGPRGGDEVNLTLAGRNYGWPVIGYGIDYDGSTIHQGTHREGMEQPVHHWTPSIATSGMLIYTGDAFPAWRGDFFVGGLVGQQIARLTMDGHQVVSEETLFEGLHRIRDIREGPDGFIYIATDLRQGGPSPILRFEPVASN
jgi:aldose sugar dehydrogenase